ncbi:MAG: hypothetical protein JXR68_08905 [Bacteroidales bacterium]|nr:hypothetical protein [Bacteroidales bacterium]
MGKPILEHEKYYHVFNRGNNYENLFLKTEHYEYFLKLYTIYIEPIAETFAWCLIKNHFHVLIRIKDEQNIGFLNSENAKKEDLEEKWQVFFPDEPDKRFNQKPKPHRMFQHLFNAYARWFNIKTGRINSLFATDYERKLVDNPNYYRNLIVYINNNPVHHGFVEHPSEYPWSSYNTIVNKKQSLLKRNEVINFFDNINNFKYIHKQKQNLEKIKDYIIE